MIHELKILTQYFEEVKSRRKTFEIRKNDRNFKVGDDLILKEWDGEKFTGRKIERTISYILYDWPCGLKDGYCVMSLASCTSGI